MSAGCLALAVALVAGAVTPLAAQAWTEREVAAGTKPTALYGTLTLPDGATPVPGVLFLAGSGPVDRDGNQPKLANNSLRLLAHALAEQGVASLRADKRGVGASRTAGSREEDLRLDTYVTDTVTWLNLLRTQPRISRVFLLGHSEGALVATLAAQRAGVAGLVLVAGAGEPAGRLIERQLGAAGVPETLRETSRCIVAALEAGRTMLDVPADLAPLFRPSVQPYLASWLPLDPVAELARVRAPVLIVQGTADLHVGVGDAQRLAAARPEMKLVLIEGMNHLLKQAPGDRTADPAAYPDLPLAPGLATVIGTFLKR